MLRMMLVVNDPVVNDIGGVNDVVNDPVVNDGVNDPAVNDPIENDVVMNDVGNVNDVANNVGVNIVGVNDVEVVMGVNDGRESDVGVNNDFRMNVSAAASSAGCASTSSHLTSSPINVEELPDLHLSLSDIPPNPRTSRKRPRSVDDSSSPAKRR